MEERKENDPDECGYESSQVRNRAKPLKRRVVGEEEEEEANARRGVLRSVT